MPDSTRPIQPFQKALRPFARRFSWAAVYFLVVFLIGTVGYMAITTVTSVGFMEVNPLSGAGRSFTIFLIVLGMTGLGIWWALITARGLRKDLTIVARAYDEESLSKRHKVGADHTISPNRTGGIRMASQLLRPSVVSFLDVSTTGTEIELRLEQVSIPEESSLAGASLAEAQIPQRTGLIVLALQKLDAPDKYLYNPGPDTKLAGGGVMLVLGGPDQIAKLRGYVARA